MILDQWQSKFPSQNILVNSKAEAIKTICEVLIGRGVSEAAEIARQVYPFTPARPAITRRHTEEQALRIFLRDGFVDRYSGGFLLFPPVLRILTTLLPNDFPFHRNWKMGEIHQAYWELFPTLDHVLPIVRGGQNDEHNLVSTSMYWNSAKANATLEEIGWTLHPPGDMKRWDGMLAWCADFLSQNATLLNDKYIGRWYRASLPFR
ncbi:MAG: HNH endonuclease [Thermodesulfobacteriota bacterium]